MDKSVDAIIEELVNSVQAGKSAREQFLFRQSLHNLVRLARSELLLEIRRNAERLTQGLGQERAEYLVTRPEQAVDGALDRLQEAFSRWQAEPGKAEAGVGEGKSPRLDDAR